MKTVVIVSHHNSNWGAERSTCSAAAYLKSIGFRVILVIPSEGKILEIIERNELEHEIHYFRTWINYRGTNYFRAIASTGINLYQLLKLYRKFKKKGIAPDIIYTNTLVHGFGILLARLYHIPHIQHIRENIDSFGMKFNWGFTNTIRLIDKYSYKVAATCTAIKDRYEDTFNPLKMKVIYNGIPIQPYVEPSVSPSIFTMVYAGRLYKDKRPQDILQSVKKLVNAGFSDIRLDIYGEGPMEEEVRDYIVKNGLGNHIIIKGYQNKINFSNYYVGLMPSEFEAFARTTLEYMMNGLAVIGTNTGGTKEQILHGVTGYTYTPGDIDAIVDHIKRLHSDRESCLELGKQGYQRVSTEFSQDRYVKDLGATITSNIC